MRVDWQESYQKLAKAGWIRVESEVYELSGEDRKKFLNSYNTQDVASMPVNSVASGVFLTQKGKIVSDAVLMVLADKILVLLPPGYGTKVSGHLETFLLFSAVEWKDQSPEWSHVLLFGPQAPESLREAFSLKDLPAPNVLLPFSWGQKELYLLAEPGHENSAWRLLVPRSAETPVEEALLKTFGKELEPAVLQALRVEAGLPEIGVDMGEDNLVAEVGLDKSATSFNKGCYLGQETTARVHSQGHVNRRLTRVRLGQENPGALPAELLQGEKKAGVLTSAVESPKFGEWIGLATITRQALEHPEGIYLNAAGKKIQVGLI